MSYVMGLPPTTTTSI